MRLENISVAVRGAPCKFSGPEAVLSDIPVDRENPVTRQSASHVRSTTSGLKLSNGHHTPSARRHTGCRAYRWTARRDLQPVWSPSRTWKTRRASAWATLRRPSTSRLWIGVDLIVRVKRWLL